MTINPQKTKVERDTRSTGHQRFRQTYKGWPGSRFEWKETTLDIRRVKNEDREEVQIEIRIDRTTKTVTGKSRVFTEGCSFILSPEMADEMIQAMRVVA